MFFPLIKEYNVHDICMSIMNQVNYKGYLEPARTLNLPSALLDPAHACSIQFFSPRALWLHMAIYSLT